MNTIIIENIDFYTMFNLFVVAFSVFENEIRLYDGFSIM